MKKALSIILTVVILLTLLAVTPFSARKADVSSTGGWPEKITLNTGAAFKENTSWYVWTWSWDESFSDGHWIRGKTQDYKTVYFSGHGPNVVFACMDGDVSDPDWDKVVLQTSETDVDGFYYTITDIEKKHLVGEWSWDAPIDPTDKTDPTEQDKPSDKVTHEAFAILNPVSTRTYYVNDEIEVQVGCARYYYTYSANGSRLNTPNTVVLEFNHNNRVVHTSVINFHADDLGYYLTDEFTPSSAGTYIVRVGYSKSSITSVGSNYVGSYAFEVLPKSTPTETPTESPTEAPTEAPTDIPDKVILGDADCDNSVTILDATAIQRKLAGLPMQAFNKSAADCDGDTWVTILDATAIQRHLADLPTEAKGIGKPIA